MWAAPPTRGIRGGPCCRQDPRSTGVWLPWWSGRIVRIGWESKSERLNVVRDGSRRSCPREVVYASRESMCFVYELSRRRGDGSGEGEREGGFGCEEKGTRRAFVVRGKSRRSRLDDAGGMAAAVAVAGPGQTGKSATAKVHKQTMAPHTLDFWVILWQRSISGTVFPQLTGWASRNREPHKRAFVAVEFLKDIVRQIVKAGEEEREEE